MSPATGKHTRLNHNFWVGFFTIIGLLLLAAITVSLRNWDFLSNRSTYYARFENVKRLAIGADVLAAGVPIGEVVELRAIDQGSYQVLVKIRIDDEVKLYPNARASVAAAAVIGDTTINIDKGSGSNPLTPGSVIDGEKQPEIEDIARDVSESINSVTSILNDPKTREAIQRTLVNLASATEKIDATFGMINSDLRPMVASLQQTARNMDAFLADARGVAKTIGGEVTTVRTDLSKTAKDWSEAARALSAQVERTADALEQVTNQLQGTIQKNEAPLANSIQQLEEATRLMRDVAEDLRRGEGTLGLLINDPKPFQDMSRILEGLARTLGGSASPAFGYDATPARTPVPNSGSISPTGELPDEDADAERSPGAADAQERPRRSAE